MCATTWSPSLHGLTHGKGQRLDMGKAGPGETRARTSDSSFLGLLCYKNENRTSPQRLGTALHLCDLV